MEYRKLIAFGKSSFIVSLPKQWVTKHKLKKGDTIIFDEKDTNLLLQPKASHHEEEKKIMINIDGKDIRRIQREIISAYIKNNKTISLIGDDIKGKAEKIQGFIQKLVALEIIEQDSKKIVAKDFLNIGDINLPQIMRKMDIITRSMLEDCKNMFDEDNYENINLRDNDVNKFHFLVFRIVGLGMENSSILKKIDLEQKDLLNLWWLAFSVEKIADCVKRIARYMREIRLNDKNKQKFKKILDDVGKSYIEMMKGYYAKDSEIVHKILQKRKEIIKRCDDFFIENRNAPFIGYLIYNTKAFLVNTHTIGRIIYQEIPG
jgi:phosphate uptake regulator